MSDDAEHETARVTVTRGFNSDGEDFVRVDDTDFNDGRLNMVEILGLLEMAKFYIVSEEAEADDEP